jgi:hypothetical protein
MGSSRLSASICVTWIGLLAIGKRKKHSRGLEDYGSRIPNNEFRISVSIFAILFISTKRSSQHRGGSGGRRGWRPAERTSEDGIGSVAADSEPVPRSARWPQRGGNLPLIKHHFKLQSANFKLKNHPAFPNL